jgi:hypothetical protein
MKTEQNCMDYEAPQVEIVEVEVEQGFYLSDLDNGGDYNS